MAVVLVSIRRWRKAIVRSHGGGDLFHARRTEGRNASGSRWFVLDGASPKPSTIGGSMAGHARRPDGYYLELH